MVLWYLAGVSKSGEVKPTGQAWKTFQMSAESGRIGLKSLEEAGLVTVERHPGRCPIVTIIADPPPEMVPQDAKTEA